MTHQNPQNRRESERLPASEVPHLRARLEGSREVRLLDVSRRGMQFETSVRLRPGTDVSLRLVAHGEHVTLTGRVVRSLVSALDGTQLVYRTAVSFSEDLAFYERRAPNEDASLAIDSREGPPPVSSERDSPPPVAPAVFDVTGCEVDARLNELLSANDW